MNNEKLETGLASDLNRELYHKEATMINLMLGDCLERMKEIPDGSVDLILADPPYGTTACKWDSVIDLPLMWEQLKRVIKPNGAVVLFGAEPFSSFLRCSNIKEYKYDWVWVKEKGTGFAFSGKQPLRKYENISVFYAKQPFYNSEGEKLGKHYTHTLPISKSDSSRGAGQHNINNDGTRKYVTYTHAKKSNVLTFARESQTKSLHPTQKPILLMEYLIKTYTQEGETVLDFVMGSGTTGIACKNTGRKFIGIEKDAGYFEIAKQRIGL